jgi:NAD(P)-dependent dehydrogenase (short-subunit alcohol dehydrogenase family)
VAEVERALGGIDILVNKAGIVALTGGVLNETVDIWDNTIETHLNACFLLSQLVAKSMVKRMSGGKIITWRACTRSSDPVSCLPTAQRKAVSFS